MNIGVWLSRLGLEQYEAAFDANDIEPAILTALTAEDLIALGVTSVGHRRKLLAAIAALAPDTGTDRADRTASPAAFAEPPPAAAERRQLTVMFCDLVGSTALSARLDPEDLREIIGAYHRTIAEIVSEAGGFVSRYMGDGVLVYFGYPQARENDAERAVRVGLRAVEAVSRMNLKSVTLQARVGIATGLVVVGDLVGEGSAREHSVVGETPNVAARLQALAEPNTVVIADTTHRLVGGLFDYHDLGPLQLKGLAQPVSVWQVLRPSVVASRFEALRGSALAPLVGRDEEIDLLLRRWRRAKAGDGQIVLVSGEAGIGKSRITAALNERLNDELVTRLWYFCSPYYQDSALFPFVEQLGRAAGFTPEDAPGVKLEKLHALAGQETPSELDIAVLADLLSLPVARHVLAELSPQRKKERTLEVLRQQLEGLARHRPVMVVFEDAHWIDPTSRELLDLAIERIRELPVLLLVTFRPEFQPAWIGQPQVTVLTLNRLDRRDRSRLVIQLAGGKTLPSDVVNQIVDRTDGVPLFVEELTKSILESGSLREEADRYVLDRTLPSLSIPTSLRDLLMARLDRLASVRYLAQIGAAIGRDFGYLLLKTVSGLPDDELQAALASLVASELVFERGTPPNTVYAFKHALVQEVAHGSLLRDARQQLHAKIAQALEIHFPELAESQPELLAQHYGEAGFAEKSMEYWGRAGRRSADRSAMVEAAAQLQKGLDQLALLPETPERLRRELEFWSALGAALRYVKGQATPEMGNAFAHARALWERLGAPSEFLFATYGQARYHMYRGEFDLALRLDQDLVDLSHKRNDTAGLVLGHLSCGRDLMAVGKFAASKIHLENVLDLYDPIAHRPLTQETGSDPRIGAAGQLAIALFCLGRPEEALKRSNDAIADASDLAHPPSLAASLAQGSRLLSLMGDHTGLDQRAAQLIEVATEQGFPLYRALGAIYRGWGKAEIGDAPAGLSLLRDGLEAYRATGAETRMSYYMALLAKALDRAGQHDKALDLLDEALRLSERIGECWFTAELYRCKGELLSRLGETALPEQLYRAALTLAAEQEAKLWELRAATSLARMELDGGFRAAARDTLRPVYAAFTEGFDTRDLRHARQVLQQAG